LSTDDAEVSFIKMDTAHLDKWVSSMIGLGDGKQIEAAEEEIQRLQGGIQRLKDGPDPKTAAVTEELLKNYPPFEALAETSGGLDNGVESSDDGAESDEEGVDDGAGEESD
jgi:hypothetical protein